MKKINTTEISLVIIIMVIGIIVNVFSGYYVKISNNSIIDNGFYTDNVKGITIKANEENIKIPKLKDFIIHKSLANVGQNYDVREIYFKGEVHIPPMIKGKFLEEDNFSMGNGKAVIGKDVKENVISENGKDYFLYYDKKYEIIGTVGVDRPSDLDTQVFLTMESGENLQGLYFIDGMDKDNVNKVFNELIDSAKGLSGEIELEKGSLSLGINFIIIYTLTIISLLCSTMLLLYYYIEKEKKKIAIKKLCGYSNKSLVKEIVKRQIVIVTLGFLIGTCIFIIFRGIFELKTISILNLLISYIIVSVLNIGVLSVPVNKIIKIDTSILLK